MIRLVNDTITHSDIDALRDWLGTYPRLTQGYMVEKFEESFSAWLGVRNSVMVNSGSSGLLLALSGLKEVGFLKTGDPIAVPALCWATDASSVINLGFKPVLVDCNLQDLSVDIGHLKRVSKGVKALVLVHVLGLVPDMEAINQICHEENLLLVEDCCEALGSEHHGQKLGTYGDVSVFSFFYSHQLSTIEGGMVCTDNPDLADTLRSLRSHGFQEDRSSFEDSFKFVTSGYNIRSTEINAFLGLLQLARVDDVVESRQDNMYEYLSKIDPSSWKKLGFDLKHTYSNFAYPVLTPNRDKVVKALEEVCEVRPILAGNVAMQPFYHRTEVVLTNADRVWRDGLYLPNHPDLTTHDIQTICDVVNQHA